MNTVDIFLYLILDEGVENYARIYTYYTPTFPISHSVSHSLTHSVPINTFLCDFYINLICTYVLL